MRITLFELDLQSVVIGIIRAVIEGACAKVGKWPALLKRPEVGRTDRSQVCREVAFQECTLATHISRLESHGASDFPLDREVPLIHPRGSAYVS